MHGTQGHLQQYPGVERTGVGIEPAKMIRVLAPACAESLCFVPGQVGQSTDSAKTTRLSQFLQEVFRADTDLTTLRLAAGTMGRLVKAGGPLTADVVDIEVCQKEDPLPNALPGHSHTDIGASHGIIKITGIRVLYSRL